MGYTMNLSMIEYKTLIIREELEAAAQLLPSIPKVCFACPEPNARCMVGVTGASTYLSLLVKQDPCCSMLLLESLGFSEPWMR